MADILEPREPARLGLVGIDREDVVVEPARMRDMVDASPQGALRPAIVDVDRNPAKSLPRSRTGCPSPCRADDPTTPAAPPDPSPRPAGTRARIWNTASKSRSGTAPSAVASASCDMAGPACSGRFVPGFYNGEGKAPTATMDRRPCAQDATGHVARTWPVSASAAFLAARYSDQDRPSFFASLLAASAAALAMPEAFSANVSPAAPPFGIRPFLSASLLAAS